MLATLATLSLAACSTFNMAPACEETGLGLQRMIAVPKVEAPVDRARLAGIVQAGDFVEIGSAYNERTCSAHVTVGDLTATVRYRIRQSEGLKDWYDIELLDAEDPTLQEMLGVARAAYASGS